MRKCLVLIEAFQCRVIISVRMPKAKHPTAFTHRMVNGMLKTNGGRILESATLEIAPKDPPRPMKRYLIIMTLLE